MLTFLHFIVLKLALGIIHQYYRRLRIFPWTKPYYLTIYLNTSINIKNKIGENSFLTFIINPIVVVLKCALRLAALSELCPVNMACRVPIDSVVTLGIARKTSSIFNKDF